MVAPNQLTKRYRVAGIVVKAALTAAFGSALACASTALPGIGGRARAADVLVFAAASTAGSLDAVADAFARRGHARPRLSFAASSALARQIDAGAPADIFLSADEEWMDFLARRSVIVAESRRDLLGNRLVLVAPADTTWRLSIAAGFDLAGALGGDGRLAMGDPDHVPAGIYGRAALVRLGAWDGVAARAVRAADVRAALVMVERGEAAAGVVYATDARLARRVRIVDTFPADSHPPIAYPMAIVAGRDRPEARAFAAFLRSPEAAAIFERAGFAVPDP